MSDENKKTEEKAEEPVEEKTGEIQEESKDKTPKQEPTEPIEEIPEQKEETEDTPETIDEPKEDQQPTEEATPEEQQEPTKEEKPEGTEPAKDTKKTEKKKDDFKYIVRIANTDVDGEKNVVMGLSQIKGIGRHMAVLITDYTKLDRTKKIGDLKDAEIERINDALTNLPQLVPKWMLNHQKDFDTGKDIHLISAEVDMKLRDDINLLKMIRSYRGIRHELGLRVRGQRTRANNRRGLALGVSKKTTPGTSSSTKK